MNGPVPTSTGEGIEDLPEEASHRLKAELAPGEVLVWAGRGDRPIPGPHAARPYLQENVAPSVAVGLLFLGLVVLAMIHLLRGPGMGPRRSDDRAALVIVGSIVLGGLGLSELTEHEVVEGAMVAPDQGGERLPIAPLVADHQSFVGCVTRGGGHGARAGRQREMPR